MELRQQQEQLEAVTLSPHACRAAQTRGRARPETECGIRTCFQRDTDRIVYSKAFRRLKHKTQVFLQPLGDHYRTRMTHTLEVSRIARTIARALALNEDLTEAIALGHDLGHTPFGHAGERLLNELMPGGFAHYQQSLRVVDRLEIPLEVSGVLGFTHGERINALVVDVIRASRDQDSIRQSEEAGEAMSLLREFMFENVYTNPMAKGEEGKAQEMLRRLFDHYRRDPDALPADFQEIRLEEGVDRAVCDYIAGMTDPFAIEQFSRLFIPTAWSVK
jgi:dGTPase